MRARRGEIVPHKDWDGRQTLRRGEGWVTNSGKSDIEGEVGCKGSMRVRSGKIVPQKD